jgi:class 3 adenylate cyclase
MSTTPQIIAALLALGMALAFSLADRDSSTSRAMSLFLVAVGVSIVVSSQIEIPLRDSGQYPVWGGLFAIPEVLAFLFAFEWILRVRRTIPTRELPTQFADKQLRVAQALAILYFVLALLFPRVRAEQFIGAAWNGSAPGLGFLMFAAPIALSLILGVGAGLITLNRRPDIAERQRLVAFSVAAPFMASGLVLPIAWAPVLTSFGLIIFLIGGVQYHVIQGRRAQFMSRFLAPQVAELVRESGLKSATRHQTLEISVVCCDLRGFTAFSSATDSKKVIQILREYYDMVGTAVASVGGTIKDQAGDGVLVLIGAPIWSEDHVQRAIELARRIREGGVALSTEWSTPELQLGVGVGAATGFVTVGVIGAASRLEYTAVGPAVNLASRLCSEAVHGEVLVDERSNELLANSGASAGLRLREPLNLKGFVQPVPNFVLETV